MSTPTETTRGIELADGKYLAGAVGGAAGALVMGGLVLAMNDAVLAVAIPSLYTLAPPPNPAVGMAVHVFHGTVLGLVFAGGVAALDLDSPGTVVAAGLGWGAVTWVLLAALVMPVWLGAVGSPASPPLPNFAPPSLLWHLVYGGVLAGVYVALGGRR
jgi:hypothetical protein